MFRIRRIYDDGAPINKTAIAQVQHILKEQFPLIRASDIDKIPDQLKNPLKYQFRSIIFIADDIKSIKGFALLMHAPDLNFCYLDYISTAKNQSGRGIGGALYERIREEVLLLKCKGLFFECLPDDPKLCKDPKTLKENISRLKFYEYYGASPVINTLYETPVKEGEDNPPLLVIDKLGQNIEFSAEEIKRIVKAILERKYSNLCSKEYVSMVIDSIKDNPVKLRPLKYIRKVFSDKPKTSISKDQLITLLFNDKHSLHHVRERGYVESPVRIENILKELSKTDIFLKMNAHHYGNEHITSVHNKDFVNYLHTVCSATKDNESIYPYVFPIRNNTRPPKELPMRAGYYCIDTFTPLNKSAYEAARGAVDCALTGAESLLKGTYLAYALIRPPGHHAEKNSFGGFCYFNSTAIAAHYLSKHGKVAILDIDYHHGNGQQNIFYERDDVFTISIHGHPRFAYPFFSGFEDETGANKGLGYNVNFPLAEHIENEKYIQTLEKAINKIKTFSPAFLIVALGFDTAKGDPTGTWGLTAKDYEKIGQIIGDLPFSTLFVQEGGYKTKTLGKNALAFFKGVWNGSFL